MIQSLRKKLYLILAVPILLAALSVIFYIYPGTQNDVDITWIATCNDPKLHSGEFKCWVDGIESIIQRKGLNTAFALISSRLVNEPSFKRSCNQILHEAGHWTYHYTTHNNIKFIVPQHVTICAHGFDRAFVHELAVTTGDFSKAVEFCTDPRLAAESPESTASCYHDIGHGAIGFYGPRMSGEQQKLISRGLEECEKISHTPLELDYCGGGVFSEIIKFFQTNQYGVSVDREDPFSFCREQDQRYKKMCYATAKPLLLWLANQDFSKAASFIEGIIEDEYATVAIDALATAVTMQNIGKGVHIVDYAGDISACRELQERLRLPCIGGLAIELLTHSLAAEALEFCRLPTLTDKERDACFGRVVPNLYEWTPRDDIQQICSSLEEKYKDFCRY